MKNKHTKRLATKEEAKQALRDHISLWNSANPNHIHPENYWKNKLAEALKEGYKNEVCSCGVVFLAFHHFTTCSRENCPFSDGISLLDRLEESLGKNG
jgi:hypothetical protein